MTEKPTRQDCIAWLLAKQKELNRLPKKGDFTADQVAAIKSFLGPFPRALETAGIKSVGEQHLARRQKT